MEKKKVVAAASLSMVLLASFALVILIPPTSAPPVPVQNRRYIVMGGMTCSISDLVNLANITLRGWTTPYHTRAPYLMPLVGQSNITFSDKWQLGAYGWIVNLTVPHETYVGLKHVWYEEQTKNWYRLTLTLEEDAYGWVFLNATGDVDCYTFNNCTGVYWKSPSRKAGQLAAARGALPSPGLDRVAGTADDGFGDNHTDPRGSSILMMPGKMHVDYWGLVSPGVYNWTLLFESPWPQVFTTGTAYDTVIAPGRRIDGRWNSTVGEPCEFYAGLDTGYKVNYGHPKWNAYVTYACAWSMLNISTILGPLDIIFQAIQKPVREDCVIGDVDGNELVDSMDILVAGLAFGAEDEGSGPDDKPGTLDDKPIADHNYDARGDISDDRGIVDSMDILVLGLDFGSELRPTCIWRPF